MYWHNMGKGPLSILANVVATFQHTHPVPGKELVVHYSQMIKSAT